jgi:hypothetical protein
MRAEPDVQQPDEDHVDERAEADRVPHDHRYARGDAVKAGPPCFHKCVELLERRVVDGLLAHGLGLKLDHARVELDDRSRLGEFGQNTLAL